MNYVILQGRVDDPSELVGVYDEFGRACAVAENYLTGDSFEWVEIWECSTNEEFGEHNKWVNSGAGWVKGD